MAILKKGMAGEPVRRLQAKLGVEADAKFGPKTVEALKAYQTKNVLKVDGVAGPDTFAHMGLYELVLIKKGTSGETVKKLQEELGLTADGKFGAATEKAIKAFQEKNGLKADGMAGPLTLSKMKTFKEITPQVVSQSRVSTAIVDAWEAITGSGKDEAEITAPPAPKAPEKTADVTSTRSIWETIKGVFS
ncbi:MAG: peptidoglycan-binding protein [Chitinophagales bacterium]|nr:peptidoglycan-binding protein [Hyphomicrobiales bacterium]